MKNVGVVIHPAKPEAKEAAQEFAAFASARGFSVAEAAGPGEFDVVVAFGGDGTILRAAGLAERLRAPLLGVNLGRLGYLTTINSAQLEEAVDRLHSGAFSIEERMMLHAVARADHRTIESTALNEFVVERADPSRVVDIAVSVGDEEVATYTADGLIVATPTGSTAYSLSAGGPIVEPGVEGMVLTPVSAHSPLWRSIVISASKTVQLRAVRGMAELSGDGQPLGPLAPGAVVEIRPHDRPLQLINLDGYRFFRRVRTRFHLDSTE